MYKDSLLTATIKHPPQNILIIKTSSLGDIIQSFNVLDELHRRFPGVSIDWAVEESLYPIAAAHPLIRKAISLNIKGLKKGWRHWSIWRGLFSGFSHLRETKYDLIFDLQGNCKSGVITFLSRGKVKVGFGSKSVREWPNLLATRCRFNVPKQLNIRIQYLRLIQQYFNDPSLSEMGGVRFKIGKLEKEKLSQLLSAAELQTSLKIMVCPGSKWVNKQMTFETLLEFLKLVQKQLNASFVLVWGADSEKTLCQDLQAQLPNKSLIVDRLTIPAWQNLMNEMGLVIAVDSSALHLCGTTSTPSFSVFGPTSPEIFKPIGQRHFAIQGKCPYNRTFEKQCPVLRTCPTGACIRDLKADELFHSFLQWWNSLSLNNR